MTLSFACKRLKARFFCAKGTVHPGRVLDPGGSGKADGAARSDHRAAELRCAAGSLGVCGATAGF